MLFTKDVKLSKYHVSTGDTIEINFVGLHFNQNEWQRPYEFLPERFDPAHELSLTPGGKKRSAYSFLPFSAGKRVCFGKTFAEMNLKIVTVYLSQYFDFEMVDKQYKANNYPMLNIGMSKTVPIEVKFSNSE